MEVCEKIKTSMHEDALDAAHSMHIDAQIIVLAAHLHAHPSAQQPAPTMPNLPHAPVPHNTANSAAQGV